MSEQDPAALVARAKELVSEATPGPWSWDDAFVYGPDPWNVVIADCGETVTARDENAALIAAAPTLIADLASALEAALADRARLREALHQIADGAPTERDDEPNYGNFGDEYYRGEMNSWFEAAKIARAALAPDAKEEDKG